VEAATSGPRVRPRGRCGRPGRLHRDLSEPDRVDHRLRYRRARRGQSAPAAGIAAPGSARLLRAWNGSAGSPRCAAAGPMSRRRWRSPARPRRPEIGNPRDGEGHVAELSGDAAAQVHHHDAALLDELLPELPERDADALRRFAATLPLPQGSGPARRDAKRHRPTGPPGCPRRPIQPAISSKRRAGLPVRKMITPEPCLSIRRAAAGPR
jgi:hypothetical protein